MNDLQAMQGAIDFAKVLQNCLTNPKTIEDAGEAIRGQLALTAEEMAKRDEYNQLFHDTNDAIKALAADKQKIADDKQANTDDAAELKKAWDNFNTEKNLLTADQSQFDADRKEFDGKAQAVADREDDVGKRELAVKSREDAVKEREDAVKIREDAVAKRISDLQAPVTADK